MFEEPKLLGTKEQGIILETKKGRRVNNHIAPPPTEQNRRIWKRWEEKFFNWKKRKPLCGGYNCAGHVWASRRTTIIDDIDIEVSKILEDDGYRKLAELEKKKPGDIIIYLNGEDNSFIHVGRIIELRSLDGTSEGNLPLVLSKWNDNSGEYIHHHLETPYSDHFELNIQYWTDRPIPG